MIRLYFKLRNTLRNSMVFLTNCQYNSEVNFKKSPRGPKILPVDNVTSIPDDIKHVLNVPLINFNNYDEFYQYLKKMYNILPEFLEIYEKEDTHFSSWDRFFALPKLTHVTACYESMDFEILDQMTHGILSEENVSSDPTKLYTLVINEFTPKSDHDFMVLNFSRACADISLFSGELLRKEKFVSSEIIGRPDVVKYLLEFRNNLNKVRQKIAIDCEKNNLNQICPDSIIISETLEKVDNNDHNFSPKYPFSHHLLLNGLPSNNNISDVKNQRVHIYCPSDVAEVLENSIDKLKTLKSFPNETYHLDINPTNMLDDKYSSLTNWERDILSWHSSVGVFKKENRNIDDESLLLQMIRSARRNFHSIDIELGPNATQYIYNSHSNLIENPISFNTEKAKSTVPSNIDVSPDVLLLSVYRGPIHSIHDCIVPCLDSSPSEMREDVLSFKKTAFTSDYLDANYTLIAPPFHSFYESLRYSPKYSEVEKLPGWTFYIFTRK